jgi:O-methyltransferase
MHNGGYTMIGCRRGRTLYRLAAEVERRGIGGSLVDCGVGNGGSTAILASGAPSRTVWAFDSFEPSPDQDEDDDSLLARSGYSGRLYPPCSEARAREAVGLIADPAQLQLVKGWVDQTYPDSRQEVGGVALLHTDLESYESTQLTLETFYPVIKPGGYVVVNCYGDWPEVRRATGDFRLRNAITDPFVRVDHAGVYWRKT